MAPRLDFCLCTGLDGPRGRTVGGYLSRALSLLLLSHHPIVSQLFQLTYHFITRHVLPTHPPNYPIVLTRCR